MGAQPSTPMPGARVQVIGVGFMRTGTASISSALSTLLDGPVYHSGTQVFQGSDESHIKRWMSIFRRMPASNTADKEFIFNQLQRELTGYVATADTPAAQFVPELLQLYPDAKVVCTMRDPDAWVRSFGATVKVTDTATFTILRLMVYWVPCVRHLAEYTRLFRAARLDSIYGAEDEITRAKWDRHIAWVKQVVPEEKLLLFDVKDGWEPLCTFLDLPIPKNTRFPHVNDGKAIEEISKKRVQEGLFWWLGVVGTAVTAAAVSWKMFTL